MSDAPAGKITVAHTAELEPATLAAARDLLYEIFPVDMTEHDWDHSIGGVHAIAWEGEKMVGHASVVQRRLMHSGRALRTGYVEGVGVLETHRRRGHATAMLEALEDVIRKAYELGGLATTDMADPFYAGRGWQRWRGPTFALTPEGVVRTEADDGGIFVLPVSAPVDLAGEIACDWRDADLW